MENKELLVAAGINYDDLMKRLMNNEKLVKIILTKLFDDTNYNDLVSAIADGDMEKAEKCAHTLKGVCGNCSLERLYELFCEQLRLFRTGESEKAVSMMDEIAAEHEKAEMYLRMWLDKA